MKQKKLIFLAALAGSMALALGVAGCESGKTDGGNDNAHTHTYASEWTSDDTYHWHRATCEHTDEKGDRAEHDFTDGDCVCGKKKPVAVTEIVLSQTGIKLKIGETCVLTATVAPENATDQNVAWSSDKPSVASVENGTVEAKAEGEAVITATAGGKSASCTVTIIDQPAYTEGLVFEKIEDGYKIAGFEPTEPVNHLTIPEKYDGLPVTEIAEEAFSGASFQTVDIPSSVKRIGSGAFYLSAVEEVVLPDSVETIGYAFYKAEKLKAVTLGNGIAELETYAFYEASGLETVVLGNGLQKIGNDAFAYTGKLDIAWAPDGQVTTIGKRAFQHSLMEELTIPDTVTSIEYNAISDCYALRRVTIGSNAVPADKVFSNCPNIVEIYNRSGIEFKIGQSCDWNSYSANSRTYNPLPKNVCTSEGGRGTLLDVNDYLFYKFTGNSGTECYLLGYNGTDTALTLPDPSAVGVASYKINRYAFWENKSFAGYYNETYNKLGSVVIPNGVTEIGEAAFESRPNLTSVTVGEDVALFGSYAFAKCAKLKTLVYNAIECAGYEHDAVNSGKKEPFNSCTALDTLTFGNKVKTVPAYMFYKRTSLGSVTIPASVTKIDDCAFFGCDLTGAVFETKSGWKTVTTSTAPTGVEETPNFSDPADILKKLNGGNRWVRS